jgi:sodium transport system permease protein
VLAGGAYCVEAERRIDDPPLIVDGQFLKRYSRSDVQRGTLEVVLLDSADQEPLRSRRLDAMIVIPPDVTQSMRGSGKPEIRILGRDGDDTSKVAVKRAGAIVAQWREHVKELRFIRNGLPHDYDEPVKITDPDDAKTSETRTADELRDVFVKFLPFLLVMWTMAGALHPAIDLTAGEKERGTMETLLISPAGRGDIVAGKFIAVTTFSYASALWNLLWMVGGALMMSIFLPNPIVSVSGLAWSALLAFPLAMLFSSLALGLGAFARSTKEGQYYLLPIMLCTLPLTMFAMTPGLKLTPVLAAIPISGLAMILQNLMAVSGEPISPLTWTLGLGSMFICVVLALMWASWQFRREAVLFRSESGPSLRGWLRILLSRE